MGEVVLAVEGVLSVQAGRSDYDGRVGASGIGKRHCNSHHRRSSGVRSHEPPDEWTWQETMRRGEVGGANRITRCGPGRPANIARGDGTECRAAQLLRPGPVF